MFSLITENGFKGFTDLAIEFVGKNELYLSFRYGGEQVERLAVHVEPHELTPEEKIEHLTKYVAGVKGKLEESSFIDKDTIAELLGGRVLRGSELKSIRIL